MSLNERNAINFAVVGTLCEILGPGTAKIFNGTHILNGQTGKYTNIQGVGNFVVSVDSANHLLLSVAGNFRQNISS